MIRKYYDNKRMAFWAKLLHLLCGQACGIGMRYKASFADGLVAHMVHHKQLSSCDGLIEPTEVKVRPFEIHVVERNVRAAILSRFTALGVPKAVSVG